MGRGQAGGQWELARTTEAAREARVHIDGHRDALGEDAWRRARLLVSELATNAVRHGRGRIVLAIRATGRGLHVSVTDDGGGGRPTRRTPGDDGGFGLHLVADLADRWGDGGTGTCVWFEVDRDSTR